MKNKPDKGSESLEQDLERKRCVACKQEIPAHASLCSICKSYQRQWKNHLQYGAGIATLFVLILTGSFWLFGRVRVAYFAREDVRLVSCSTLGSAVIVNKGDKEVFLSRVLLWMPGRTSGWIAPSLELDEKLPPGQFLRREFPPAKLKDLASFVRGVEPAQFEKLVTRAASDDACLELAFFSVSDTSLNDLRQMAGPTLNTFRVGGYLEYWGSEHDFATRVPIEGLGVLRQSSRAECK